MSCGILFNHESPRRGETFVTRKIAIAVAQIKAGLQDKLVLGNLDAVRDWGYAPEYVEAMWSMLQQPEPGDYVIGTGRAMSVEVFLSTALNRAGLTSECVEIDESYKRPAEVNELRADASKAKRVLGWRPMTTGSLLVNLMVDADMEALKCGK